MCDNYLNLTPLGYSKAEIEMMENMCCMNKEDEVAPDVSASHRDKKPAPEFQ